MNECHGDHLWKGTSSCQLCGARLRCNCGIYVREDRLERHLRHCPVLVAAHLEEIRQIETSW